MQNANKLELHYCFNDNSHSMDAQVRNKCEAEILAVMHEVALELGIKFLIESEAFGEGGLKEKWKLLGDNGPQIMVFLTILTMILSRIPVSDPELDALKKEETKLSITEKQLTIVKLKNELASGGVSNGTTVSAADAIDKNLKVVARRSNFYKSVNHCHKVESVGFSCLDNKNNVVIDELIVPRANFSKFILHSNDLPTLTVDDASIEIISPVLRQGDYKWRGIYDGMPISFSMADKDFRHDVLLKKVSFQNGSVIKCLLKVARKLNEVGEIEPVNYTVETVIEKVDGSIKVETPQGKRYKFNKKELASQENFVF